MRRAFLAHPIDEGWWPSDDLLRIFEAICDLCDELEIALYIPYADSQLRGMEAQELYQHIRARILGSDLVFAYMGKPSIDVGQMLEMAHRDGKTVISFWEYDFRIPGDGARLARRGLASTTFHLKEDLIENLRNAMDNLPIPS